MVLCVSFCSGLLSVSWPCASMFLFSCERVGAVARRASACNRRLKCIVKEVHESRGGQRWLVQGLARRPKRHFAKMEAGESQMGSDRNRSLSAPYASSEKLVGTEKSAFVHANTGIWGHYSRSRAWCSRRHEQRSAP